MSEPGNPDREVVRAIGIPRSVSPEAQAFLRQGGLTAAGREGPAPAADDFAGWAARRKATDDMLVAAFEARAGAASVEEIEVNGVPVHVIAPDGAPADTSDPVYYDIHGGALFYGAGAACRAMAKNSAERARMLTWAVDYRMPPEHPYPAPLDDCMAVYRGLLETRPPAKIVVGGASAGGNLAAALIVRAHDEGLPMPAALALLSPEVDLTESGDTFQTSLGVCSLGRLLEENRIYAGGHPLDHPYLSPLFADIPATFPPTFLQSGTRDLFLSNTVRMHRKLRDAGVDAELHVWEAMPHGGFFGAPEDAEIGDELRRFIAKHVD